MPGIQYFPRVKSFLSGNISLLIRTGSEAKHCRVSSISLGGIIVDPIWNSQLVFIKHLNYKIKYVLRKIEFMLFFFVKMEKLNMYRDSLTSFQNLEIRAKLIQFVKSKVYGKTVKMKVLILCHHILTNFSNLKCAN